MDPIYRHFITGFEAALRKRDGNERRIGAELKFPLVTLQGEAVARDVVDALWQYLETRRWRPEVDSLTGEVVGARKPGAQNDTVASCETGYCKTEFSLAHVGDLFELETSIWALREELRPFAEEHEVRFLGYGIHPVTPPSRRLLMRKSRTSVWDKVFASNRRVSAEDGDDVHLFTINAASHVHVSVSLEEAIPAVNVLNGFAGAQIALTAHSNIWRGRPDPMFKCVAEKFWDWWMPESGRVGVPGRAFDDLEDYVRTISAFRPVYVRRAGRPLVPKRYETFADYYRSPRAIGLDPDGREVSFVPDPADIDLHSTCYWFNARLSRYYTVENRVNDQQPPADLVCVAALTLGLISALPEAAEEVASRDWELLRAMRESACCSALADPDDCFAPHKLCHQMLDLARAGLTRRGLGEAQFLDPLDERMRRKECPADEAADIFRDGGVEALVEARKL